VSSTLIYFPPFYSFCPLVLSLTIPQNSAFPGRLWGGLYILALLCFSFPTKPPLPSMSKLPPGVSYQVPRIWTPSPAFSSTHPKEIAMTPRRVLLARGGPRLDSKYCSQAVAPFSPAPPTHPPPLILTLVPYTVQPPDPSPLDKNGKKVIVFLFSSPCSKPIVHQATSFVPFSAYLSFHYSSEASSFSHPRSASYPYPRAYGFHEWYAPAILLAPPENFFDTVGFSVYSFFPTLLFHASPPLPPSPRMVSCARPKVGVRSIPMSKHPAPFDFPMFYCKSFLGF